MEGPNDDRTARTPGRPGIPHQPRGRQAAHREGGGGHAFNAVNHQGTVFFIDAQPTGGAVDTWPPKRSSPGYGFDETDVNEVFVNYRGA